MMSVLGKGYNLLGLAMVLVLSPANAEWTARTDAVMGTEVYVQLWHNDSQQANLHIDAVMQDMHRIDALMSTYKSDSEISRVNDQAALVPVEVSEELFELVQQALALGHMTQGAFDVTYASVGKFFDFRNKQKPSPEQIKRGLQAISLNHVVLDESLRTIRFTHPDVRIDLGGIAKGHAVERAVGYLRKSGIQHAIVTAGGDSRVLGDHRGRPWAVGIQNPRADDKLAARLPLQDEAISTSGDYERFFIVDGQRFHHIMEPGSGKTAREVRSVTVIGPNATVTDALSTGVFVLGTERGLALINTLPNFEAIVIDANGKMHYSEGLSS